MLSLRLTTPPLVPVITSHLPSSHPPSPSRLSPITKNLHGVRRKRGESTTRNSSRADCGRLVDIQSVSEFLWPRLCDVLRSVHIQLRCGNRCMDGDLGTVYDGASASVLSPLYSRCCCHQSTIHMVLAEKCMCIFFCFTVHIPHRIL